MKIKAYLSAFFCGLIFSIGLTISNMINANKIINFLDFFGTWDPSLLIVLISAVSVTFIGYQLERKMAHPLFDSTFHPSTKTTIDRRLIVGAIIFGLGWGLSGYCPGPAFSAIGLGIADAFYFFISLILSSIMIGIFFK